MLLLPPDGRAESAWLRRALAAACGGLVAVLFCAGAAAQTPSEPPPEPEPAEALPAEQAPAEPGPAEPEPAEAEPAEPDREPARAVGDDIDGDALGAAIDGDRVCLNKVIKSVALQGCPTAICDVEGRRESLISLTDIEPGMTITDVKQQGVEDVRGGRLRTGRNMAEVASERLLRTGFFHDVRPDCTGDNLVFVVEANAFIRRVEIEGNEVFDKSDIRKRVIFRRGAIIDPDPLSAHRIRQIDEQIDSLERLYRKKGIGKVAIDIQHKQVGPAAYDIVINIDEGARERVGRVKIEQLTRVAPIKGEARCPIIEDDGLEDAAGVSSGDVFTQRTRRQINRRLRIWLQSLGFVKPRIAIDKPPGDRKPLTITVTTGHCWLLRVWTREAAAVIGVGDIPAFRLTDPVDRLPAEGEPQRPYLPDDFEQWRTLLPFGQSGTFEMSEARRGVAIIEGAMGDKGYLLAEVAMSHRRYAAPRDSADPRPVLGTIEYLVTRNHTRRLQDVTIAGMTISELGHPDLAGVVETEPYSFFSSTGGLLQVGRVFSDLRKLQYYYRERGYRGVRFPWGGAPGDRATRRTELAASAVDDPRDRVWRFSYRDMGFRVRKRRHLEPLDLELQLTEGAPSSIGHLEIHGHEVISAAKIRELVGVTAGGRFGWAALEKARKEVREHYRQLGYHSAVVGLGCEPAKAIPLLAREEFDGATGLPDGWVAEDTAAWSWQIDSSGAMHEGGALVARGDGVRDEEGATVRVSTPPFDIPADGALLQFQLFADIADPACKMDGLTILVDGERVGARVCRGNGGWTPVVIDLQGPATGAVVSFELRIDEPSASTNTPVPAVGIDEVAVFARDGAELGFGREVPRLAKESCWRTLGLRGSEVVDVHIEITEHEPLYVGELFWRGNFRTDVDVLTRDFPTPGQPFNEADVTRATKRLRALGVFNGVRVHPIGAQEGDRRDTSKVGLVLEVEESPARFIHVAAGIRSINRPSLGRVDEDVASTLGHLLAASDRTSIGSGRSLSLAAPEILLLMELEYLDSNALGNGWEFRAPLNYGLVTKQMFELDFSPFLLSAQPKLRIRRLGGSNLSVELAMPAEVDRVSLPNFDRVEYRADVGVDWPLAPNLVSFDMSFGFNHFPQAGSNLADVMDPSKLTPLFATSLGWRYDGQDNPLHPTTGFAFSAKFSYIRQLFAETDATQTQSLDFLKWVATAEWTPSLGRSTILALNFRYGDSSADDQSPLPKVQRFTLGGSNGLRGFADNSVGRYDRSGTLLNPAEDDIDGATFGGNVLLNGNVELRVALARAAGWWGALFVDAGALAADRAALNPASLRVSIGAGLRYMLAGQIPGRLDIGFNPAPRDDESRLDFHLQFLYPF